MDRDHRPRARSHGARELIGVKRPSLLVDVDEYRLGAAVADGIRSGDIRQSRTDHLVLGADSDRSQREVESCRPVRAGERVTNTRVPGEETLQPFVERSLRRDPVRVERLEDVLPLSAGEHGLRDGDGATETSLRDGCCHATMLLREIGGHDNALVGAMRALDGLAAHLGEAVRDQCRE